MLRAGGSIIHTHTDWSSASTSAHCSCFNRKQSTLLETHMDTAKENKLHSDNTEAVGPDQDPNQESATDVPDILDLNLSLLLSEMSFFRLQTSSSIFTNNSSQWTCPMCNFNKNQLSWQKFNSIIYQTFSFLCTFHISSDAWIDIVPLIKCVPGLIFIWDKFLLYDQQAECKNSMLYFPFSKLIELKHSITTSLVPLPGCLIVSYIVLNNKCLFI